MGNDVSRPAAVVFDLFGTLLEIASLRDAAASVTDQPDAFVATWREKQLAYAFASAIMAAHEDFDEMTAHGLRYAAAKHRVPLDAPAQQRLVEAWERVAPYPDAVPALRSLHAAGVPCAVLTNGTPATSAAAIAHAEIGELLDVTLSVEAAGVFKPDRRVYALVTDHYGVAPERIAFVSSNGWDATGAAAFGFRVAWCNRTGAPPETYGPPPAWIIRGLDELPALLLGR
jgi:2-haloacid dehalogenase